MYIWCLLLQDMDRHDLEQTITLQLQREQRQGRGGFIRDPFLDGRLNTNLAEALVREGVLTAANAPQIVPPKSMPK